jgi:excisionase family DNA binding protein
MTDVTGKGQPAPAPEPLGEGRELVAEGLDRVREAAAFLGVRVSRLYALMERGDLPYVKIGKSRRVPRRALVELAAHHLVRRPRD